MTRPGHKSVRLAGATDVVVIGAGHAGLSMSYVLGRQGVDHVVLERGEIANSWRQERWDSLRLLTPNWQTRLPGQCYAGNDRDHQDHDRRIVHESTRYEYGDKHEQQR